MTRLHAGTRINSVAGALSIKSDVINLLSSASANLAYRVLENAAVTLDTTATAAIELTATLASGGW